MVHKCPFLKQRVVHDYDPAADGAYTWELSDNPLAAVWITLKGDLVQADVCIDDMALSCTGITLTHGSFDVAKYSTTKKAVLLNSLLKGSYPYMVNSSQTIDEVVGFTFPILMGAPYLTPSMCLPSSISNRNRLTLDLDIATAYVDDLLVDIHEVILPDANPVGFIRQEEIDYAASGTGTVDKNMQTNWDILKILLYSTTVPTTTAYTATIENVGVELNDFPFGYKTVNWETLHAEIMDEMPNAANVEDHIHADPSSGNTGMPFQLEHWIGHFGVLDFFFNYDLKWKLPAAGASTCKLKFTLGVDEAFDIAVAEYVPTRALKYP